MTDEGLIKLQEAADLCAVSSGTLRRWIEEEGMPLHRPREGAAVHWKDLHKCLLRRGLPIPPELEKGPRILLVDDDADLLLVMVDLFEGLWGKARIATARDGQRGLKKLFDLRPDLLVTDIQMPNLSGIELCRWARQNRDLSHTRILAITAYHDPQKNRAALESGVDEYIRKPFAPDELLASAVRLLGPAPSRSC